MKLITNPNLIVLQSHLMTPAYSGPGKWVVFEPESKKCMLAVGKDCFPKLIEILCLFSNSGKTISCLEKTGISITKEEIELLKEKKILLEDSYEESNTENYNYLRIYQLANYDYPFNDYLNDNWFEFDYKQMEQYKKISSRPSNVQRKDAEFFTLPQITINNIPDLFRKSNNSKLEDVTLILKVTFSELERFYRPDGTFWVRKTSPSGGARHPTEGYVYFPTTLEDVPQGFYYYDYENHNFVKEEQSHEVKTFTQQLEEYDFCIVIRSHVERAMWRYRDIRALRPVLIDAGHIIETISQLLNSLGYNIKVIFGSNKPQSEISWVKNPTIAYIIASENNYPELNNYTKIEAKGSLKISENLQTSPCTFFSFRNGMIIAHTLWPTNYDHELTKEEFLLITHCLFSRRDDRCTEKKWLLDRFNNISCNQIDMLVEKNILIDKELARNLYQEIQLWSTHGWYLSFLAYLAMSSPQKINHKQVYKKTYNRQLSRDNLVNALLNRKTTRSFLTQVINSDDISKILQYAFTSFNDENEIIRVYIYIMNSDKLEQGLYEYDYKNNKFYEKQACIDQRLIREITIGQKPAGAGCITLWISTKACAYKQPTYLNAIVNLGVIGQRLCLAVTNLGLGIFLTPALNDSKTMQLLEIEDPINTIIYSFTIGHKR